MRFTQAFPMHGIQVKNECRPPWPGMTYQQYLAAEVAKFVCPTLITTPPPGYDPEPVQIGQTVAEITNAIIDELIKSNG